MSIPIRGTAWNEGVGAQLINASDATNFTGTVTVYITIDSGTQTIGSVGAGICTNEGNGYYTYRPTALETDGKIIAFTFKGTGAITATTQIGTLTVAQQDAIITTTQSNALTVRAMLTNVLKQINVIDAYEDVDPNIMTDAFERFREWVDSVCGLDKLLMYSIGRTVFTLTPNKGSLANPFTIGPSADINMPRPPLPNSIRVRYQDTSISPTLEKPLYRYTDVEWQNVPQKNLTATYPVAYYYSTDFTASGWGNLYFYFIPTSTTLQGVIYAPIFVSEYDSLDDTIFLPPGYRRFIRTNVAVELWAEFRENDPIDQTLLLSAQNSKTLVKAANVRPQQLTYGGLAGGLYDIYSDTIWPGGGGQSA